MNALLGLVRSVTWTKGVVGQKMLLNLGLLVAIGLAMTFLHPRFLTAENLSNILRQNAVVAAVGACVTLLMISRNFDLSVGGVVALSGVFAATLASSGVPISVAFALGTLVGTAVGVLNGVLVLAVGINSVIVTLGTMFLARGSALLMSGGLPVYTVPDGYSTIGAGYIGPVPFAVVIMAAIVLAMVFVERRTLLGKYARATGSEPRAAHLAGVPTSAIQLVLFALAGTAAGWAGIMLSSRVDGGIPTIGTGLEFSVIVAAVLGGTSLAGGQGSVAGTFVGAMLVGTINNGLNLLGVPTFWQSVAVGAVLILAVLLDAIMNRRTLHQRLVMQRRGGRAAIQIGADP